MKSFCCCSGAMPMPVSLTAKCRRTSCSDRDSHLDAEHHLAPLGELDRVADQVDEDLPQRGRGRPPGRPARRPRRGRPAPAPSCGRGGQRGHGVVERVAQVEVDGLQVELAGLDLGEVEDVVDHRQQVIGRELHHPEVLALLGGELGVQRQLGHADDAVHGRADLVAHVGQELALGPVGGLGGLLGPHQLPLRLLPLGDVREADDGPLDLPVAAAEGVRGVFGRECRPVPPPEDLVILPGTPSRFGGSGGSGSLPRGRASRRGGCGGSARGRPGRARRRPW